MKDYILTVDVTVSGDIHIKAKTKKEAYEKFKNMYFAPSDLRDFHSIKQRVVDIR